MTTNHLPVKYRVEVYVDSFDSDPMISLHGSNPFMSIRVGDEIATGCWPSLGLPMSSVADVIAIKHLLWEIDKSHIFHSLSVCIKMR
ncbi:MAG: hypothetical protein GQF41_3799 [Candidatus Rifleibacterium amylolyticum]|nr:MAG: hypothetical protein GQF41_3799 [Candidatus Rifleibacterium amylolyticum]